MERVDLREIIKFEISGCAINTNYMKKNTWHTKDGRTMLMSEMDDNHLYNSINYLQKLIPVGYEDWAIIPDYDGLTHDVIINRKEALAMAGYYKLLAEKRRRNLI